MNLQSENSSYTWFEWTMASKGSSMWGWQMLHSSQRNGFHSNQIKGLSFSVFKSFPIRGKCIQRRIIHGCWRHCGQVWCVQCSIWDTMKYLLSGCRREWTPNPPPPTLSLAHREPQPHLTAYIQVTLWSAVFPGIFLLFLNRPGQANGLSINSQSAHRDSLNSLPCVHQFWTVVHSYPILIKTLNWKTGLKPSFRFSKNPGLTFSSLRHCPSVAE